MYSLRRTEQSDGILHLKGLRLLMIQHSLQCGTIQRAEQAERVDNMSGCDLGS